MYKIEISLKAHQPLSLKRGVKSLQQLLREKEDLLECIVDKKRAVTSLDVTGVAGLSVPSTLFPVRGSCNRYSLTPRSEQLHLRCYSPPLLQSSHGVSLPRLQKKWTVLRSPHIDKKSREQFEWARYKDKIHIFSTKREVTLYLISLLRHSEIPGVELEFQLHFLTFFRKIRD